MRMKGFGGNANDTVKVNKKEQRKQSASEQNDLLQDLKARRVSFLESKGLMPSANGDRKFPPNHDILSAPVIKKNSGTEEKRWLLLKGYKFTVSKSSDFKDLEIETTLEEVKAIPLEDSWFRVEMENNTFVLKALLKEEMLQWVAAINTNSATLTAFSKKSNGNISSLLHGNRIHYSNEYLNERKQLEVDILSTINELVQPTEFELGELSLNSDSLDESKKKILETYSNKFEIFFVKERPKSEKNLDVFEFLRKGMNGSSGSILEGKDLAWKKLLVKDPNVDDDIEITTEEKMISYLLDQGFTDLTFVGIFLMTFRHVIKPAALIEKLIEKYNPF